MKLVEHYIMRGTRRLVLIIVGFLIFIFQFFNLSFNRIHLRSPRFH